MTILFSNFTASINFQLSLFPKYEYTVVARISSAGENVNYQYIRNYVTWIIIIIISRNFSHESITRATRKKKQVYN